MTQKTVRIAVLRFYWASSDVHELRPAARWPDEFLAGLLQRANGWSLRDYWLRASLNLLRLEFDFSLSEWRQFGAHTVDEMVADGTLLRSHRASLLAEARRLVEEEGHSLKEFDGVVAFVHSPSSDAGATSGGAVFDQGGSLMFYQHELGHVLGFQHAFGPLVPPPDEFGSLYNDSYCVMGFTGPQSHTIEPPAIAANVELVAADFWRSERRVSGAALYRRFRDTDSFVDSGWVANLQLGDRVWIAALGESDTVSPIIAVLDVPGVDGAKLVVEYRTASGDDSGVQPAVVIHSVGVHYVGDGRSEVDPPWLETTMQPSVGEQASVLGVHLEVMTVSTGTPAGIELRTNRATHESTFDEARQSPDPIAEPTDDPTHAAVFDGSTGRHGRLHQ